MTEKKTFKHPVGITSHFTAPADSDAAYEVCSQGQYYDFPLAEWDMEVTFTKKEKAFQVNDQVIVKGGGELAIIWHIIADRAWVNVVASSGGSWRDSHHVVKLSELKHAS